MFILITLTLFLLKFLAVAVVGLFFIEDLELVKSIGNVPYTAYCFLAICTFFSLFFFVLGKKFFWLIVCLISGFLYAGMYNGAPDIKEIHQQNDLKSRYFQDTNTFIARMTDVFNLINKEE
ncbi:MAG: hypothetical protein J6B00_04345 [Alphaproteobacteria bacterium]|nr:hypothetical protein [Alphaproteobacteria bacterium]MBO5441612.1 hypothetical protein [Alphaproteobacteria bacterium]